MKVCGVELKGNDAVITLLNFEFGLFDLPDCRVRKLSINDADSVEQLRDFQFTFAKLMQDYKIDRVVIRKRAHKGKFAGGAVGFKLEAAIQLVEGVQVDLMSPTDVKEQLKHTPLPVNFKDTGLKQFQENAFTTGYAYLCRNDKAAE